MLKAWTVGAGVLLAAYGAWFVSLQIETFAQVMVVLLWIAPVVAAFMSAYLAPRKKVLMGISMAIPATILASALNAGYQLLGRAVDFSGLQGGLILATIVLVENAALCAVGGLAGHFFTKIHSRQGKNRVGAN